MTKWAVMLIAFSFLSGAPRARGERPTLQNSFALRTAPQVAPAHHMKVAPDGSHAKGAEADPANWYGYGADVLAVADATVSVAMDDMPDPLTVGPMKAVEIQNASGNYIVLELGDGKYAFYEHLKAGTIRVRAGERVRRGQMIAELGYTGQSTGPHLHFHVAASTTPLNAEGLPYVFETFKTSAAKSSGVQALLGAFSERHGRELPTAFTVVEFP
jgi:murein DD-endopeptidase